MLTQERKFSRYSNVLQESYSERERVLTSLNCELIKLLDETKLLCQDFLKRKIMRDCFVRSTRNLVLPEARCELDMQEIKSEGADRALHKSGPQLHSQRMELCQANQLSDHSRREKDLALYRFGGQRKSSSRNSYEKSSGNEN